MSFWQIWLHSDKRTRSWTNQTLCVICVEEKVSIVFLPCGHFTCCEDCAPAMRRCPICREFVRGTVKTKASWCLHTFNLSSNVSPIIFVYMDTVWKPAKCIILFYSKHIAKFHLFLKLIRTMFQLRNESWHLRYYFRFGWISQSYSDYNLTLVSNGKLSQTSF